MEFNEVKTKFVDQLIGEDESQINAETDFRQLSSWDSLTAMAVIAMVEDEFKIQMTDQELKGLKNVGDIYSFVSSKK